MQSARCIAASEGALFQGWGATEQGCLCKELQVILLVSLGMQHCVQLSVNADMHVCMYAGTNVTGSNSRCRRSL